MPDGAACKECLMGEVMEGTPQGTMGELGGVKYYLAGIATGDAGRATTSTQVTDETTGPTESATKAIILCYDIFGLSVKNPKLIADALAKATSLPVYVPDYLEGDYVDPAKLHLDETLQSERPRFQRITTVVKMLVSFLVTTGPTFIYRHRAAVTVPIVEKFCTALRAGKGINRLGAVGFCLGGDVTTKLSISDDFINIAVVAHPGPLGLQDFININIPYLLILASEDPLMGKKECEVKKVLEEKKDAEYRKYDGTVHGFAARPQKSDPVVQLAFEAAFQQTVDWFKKHL